MQGSGLGHDRGPSPSFHSHSDEFAVARSVQVEVRHVSTLLSPHRFPGERDRSVRLWAMGPVAVVATRRGARSEEEASSGGSLPYLRLGLVARPTQWRAARACGL